MTYNNDWKPTEINEGQPTNWEPKKQHPEEVDESLRNAFRQAIKDGVMDDTPYLKQMTFNTDIEKTEKEIAVLQKKLELLKEIETHKSQPRMYLENSGKYEVVSYNGENYYRLEYPTANIWYKRKDDDNAVTFLKQITDGETHRLLEGLWFNDVKHGKYDEPYCPDEPEYDEVEWDEKDNPASYITDEVVDKMLKKWEENPPEFLKFEMGKTLEALITRWWCDVFGGINKDWDMETAIDDLVDRIQLWLPKSQSHEGTQDVSVIDLVDGYNDALTKIKSKLRNKK